jgi:hypothetical protein
MIRIVRILEEPLAGVGERDDDLGERLVVHQVIEDELHRAVVQ